MGTRELILSFDEDIAEIYDTPTRFKPFLLGTCGKPTTETRVALSGY